MDIWLGAALGGLIAFVLAGPSMVLELSRRTKNLPLLIDVHVWRGHKLNDGEVFAIGLLLHVLIGACYGGLYTWFETLGWLTFGGEAFSLPSLMCFAALGWVLLNVVIFPLLSFGFFGKNEGRTVWFETLISLLLEGVLLWITIQFYQPYFFFA